jgi:hypothetical protein
MTICSHSHGLPFKSRIKTLKTLFRSYWYFLFSYSIPGIILLNSIHTDIHCIHDYEMFFFIGRAILKEKLSPKLENIECLV